MKKFYFTFGQSHAHSINGKTYDKDCVVEIEAENIKDAKSKMFILFGVKWAAWDDSLPDLKYYPWGIMKI